MGGMKNVHIFRPGRHRASDGRQVEFSESDLDAIVAAYDPALHHAPVVIGHPAMDAPAHGWVKSLRRVADGIEAEVEQVNPAFAEAGQMGRYKKFSACFYEPGSAGNPVPDVYYLKHVGTLGAHPPAVKGLRSVSFAEREEGTVEFAESDLAHGAQVEAGLWRNLREWFIDKHGAEVADKVIPAWSLEALAEDAREAAKEASANDAAIESVKEEQQEQTEEKAAHETAKADTAAFAEGSPGFKAAQEAAQLRTELAKLKAERETQAQQAAHAANVAFAEGLVAKGMKPAHFDAVVSVLDVACSGGLAFAEGDTQKPLADGLKRVLEGLTGSVSFAEQATVARASRSESNPLLADALARGQKS